MELNDHLGEWQSEASALMLPVRGRAEPMKRVHDHLKLAGRNSYPGVRDGDRDSSACAPAGDAHNRPLPG